MCPIFIIENNCGNFLSFTFRSGHKMNQNESKRSELKDNKYRIKKKIAEIIMHLVMHRVWRANKTRQNKSNKIIYKRFKSTNSNWQFRMKSARVLTSIYFPCHTVCTGWWCCWCWCNRARVSSWCVFYKADTFMNGTWNVCSVQESQIDFYFYPFHTHFLHNFIVFQCALQHVSI